MQLDFFKLSATDKRLGQSQDTQILLYPSLSSPPACRRTAHTLKQLPHPEVPMLAHQYSPEDTREQRAAHLKK